MSDHDRLATLWRSKRTTVPCLTFVHAASSRHVSCDMPNLGCRLKHRIPLTVPSVLSVSSMWGCSWSHVRYRPSLFHPSVVVPRRSRCNVQFGQVLVQTSFPCVLASTLVGTGRTRVGRPGIRRSIRIVDLHWTSNIARWSDRWRWSMIKTLDAW